MESVSNLMYWTFLCYMASLLKCIEAYTDTNAVYTPCGSLQALSVGDAISIAVAVNGDVAAWYNNTDVRLNLLPACETAVADVRLSEASIAVFRPQIDQLTLLNINNNSLLALSQNFQSMSLTLYAQGKNGTIMATPRSFASTYGMISTLTTIMEFDTGFLKNFTWKDDDCTTCGAKSNMCLDNNCVSSDDICSADVSSNNSCSFGINLAFSGTDKQKQTLRSWYQVANTEKFSLSAIYLKAKKDITSSINNISNTIDLSS
ncbi:hypothetical protein MPTK1_Vg00265 [Marchantia polymorpha subsp. ruderalis]